LVTCPDVGDNSSKGLLIPHEFFQVRYWLRKDFGRFGRGLRPIS
jgi:hypothetical protein